MRQVLFATYAICAALVVSCGGAHFNPGLRTKLETRAAFDLDCKDLRFQPLEETHEVITSYGVTGCGKRATYILDVRSESWVLNSEEARPNVVR